MTMSALSSPKFEPKEDIENHLYSTGSPKSILLMDAPEFHSLESLSGSPHSDSFCHLPAEVIPERKNSPLSLDSVGSSATSLSVDALLSSSNSLGSNNRIVDHAFHRLSPPSDEFSLLVSVPNGEQAQLSSYLSPNDELAFGKKPTHRSQAEGSNRSYNARFPAFSPPSAPLIPAAGAARGSFSLNRTYGSNVSYSSYNQGYPTMIDNSANQVSPLAFANNRPGYSVQMQGGQPYHKAAMAGKRQPFPVDGYIYQVQFKRAHRNFVLSPTASRNIHPGDYVKVEADRGEDLGVVLSRTPADQFEEVMPTAGYRGRGFSTGQGERKLILRLATPEERASVASKVHDEEVALQTIREKVAERGLIMAILDAEYQYDRHKLTFYFEADRRIDFRDLVSELFSQYKTRIWMQQVDTSAVDPNDPGTELAKAAGLLPEREEYFSGQSSLSSGYGGDVFREGSFTTSLPVWSEAVETAIPVKTAVDYNYYSTESQSWERTNSWSSAESFQGQWCQERY